MTAVEGCGWGDLPAAVAREVVRALGEEWRPIARHASKAFRLAVSELLREAETGHQSPGLVPLPCPLPIGAEVVTATPELLEWAVEGQGCPLSPSLTLAAAAGGRVEVLRRAAALDPPLPLHPGAVVIAASKGNLEALKFLADSAHQMLDERTLLVASTNGHLDVVQWLVEESCPRSPYLCMQAAKEGHFHVVRWLRGRGFPLEHFSIAKRGVPVAWAAANRGNLPFLQWAVEEGAILNEDTCCGAAAGGHLDALQWLVSKGCPWDEQTLHAAASWGHLAVFLWAIAQGAPFERDQLILDAAEGGNLELLKAVRNLGCEWQGDAVLLAAQGGHLETLKWMVSNGCPWPRWGLRQCYSEAFPIHTAVMEYLRAQMGDEDLEWAKELEESEGRESGSDSLSSWETVDSEDEMRE